MRVRLTVTAIALFIGAFVHAQELVSLTPATPPALPVGGTQVFAVPPNTDLANVTFSVTPATGAKFDKASLTLTALAAGEVSLVGKNAGGNDVTTTSKITVQPVKIGAGSLAVGSPLVEGETRPIDVEVKVDADGGATLQNNTLTFTSADPAIVKVSGMTVVAQDSVKGSKSTTLAIAVNGVPLGSIPVTVLEAIKTVTARDVTVQEGKTANLEVRLTGRHDTEFTLADRKVTFTPSEVSPITISASGIVQAAMFNDDTSQTTRNVRIISNETFKRDGSVEDRADITIVQKPGEVKLSPSVLQLPREGSANADAMVLNRAGDILENAQVHWSLKNPDDTKWIKLAENGRHVQIIWNRQDKVLDVSRPNVVEVVATGTDNGATADGTLLVRMSGAVIGFSPLSVRLNLMDDHTVRDLFGARAADEYFVARVRLNNNLDQQSKPELIGSSILAFSESLEVAVVYEKRKLIEKPNRMQRLLNRDADIPDGEAKWTPVKLHDFKDFQEDTNGEALVKNDPPPQCSDTFTYRPFDASMMITTADRRDARSTRGRVMTGLQAIGTLGSFVTSVAVPGPQSDIPLGLEKYTNLLLPGIEKLWPSLKETHRQNLVTYLMRPLEEIPFGADVSRVLFFPKGPFRGLLRERETRIAQICPFHFKIQVAVIEKKQTVVSGQ